MVDLQHHSRRECAAMVRLHLMEARRALGFVHASRTRKDKTAARLALVVSLCDAMEWKEEMRGQSREV